MLYDGAGQVWRVATVELAPVLAEDDDVLTQFFDAEEIEAWFDRATTFADVIEALQRAESG